jgi:hypothetical protein
VQDIFFFADINRVPGVVAARVTDDDIVRTLSVSHVNDFAFAFVAPLGADQNCIRHNSIASNAERVGFEPTVVLPTHAFQACALNHSAISPTICRQIPGTSAKS